MSSTFLFLKFLFCFSTVSSLAAEDDKPQQMSDSPARRHQLEPKEKAITKECTDEMLKFLESTGDDTVHLSPNFVTRFWAFINEKHSPS